MRYPAWLGLLLLMVVARAAEPARDYGQVLATKVIGEVTVLDDEDGTETPLHNQDRLYEGCTIVTHAESSVILVFSNGATVRVLPNTQLTVDVFRQDPLAADLDVGSLTAEPQ